MDAIDETWLESVAEGKSFPKESSNKNEIFERLSWNYPFSSASSHRSKQSVSEIKRQREVADEGSGTEMIRKFKKPLMNRPRFMQEKALSPAEIGTAMHMVMQHMPLSEQIDHETIENLLQNMVGKELLTVEQVEVINPDLLIAFVGIRLRTANKYSEKSRSRGSIQFMHSSKCRLCRLEGRR